jgi:hypothetical protein
VDSFTSHSEGIKEHGEYGYLGWIEKEKVRELYKAAGYGGQDSLFKKHLFLKECTGKSISRLTGSINPGTRV